MKHLLNCRRTFIAFSGLVILGIALFKGTDTSGSIALISLALSGSNAAEKALIKKHEGIQKDK